MDRLLSVHVAAFCYLCVVVSLILSCYREETVSRILKETGRRSVKFVVFIGALAAVTWGVQRVFVDY
jgi:hypothetical protein